MGTYTTNYNLFMPTVGETGWGELVNGNFSTIDTTMKNLSNRITAVENEVNGALSCTSITTSGKVTANGGVTSTTGTFSGAITGASFNGVPIKSIVTVTPSNSVLKVKYFNWNGVQSFTVLPFINGVLYTGSLILYGSKASSAATVGISVINSDNSCTTDSYNTQTTYTFANIRAMTVYKYPTTSNGDVCSVPIFS